MTANKTHHTARQLAEASLAAAIEKFDALGKRRETDESQLRHALERHSESRTTASNQAIAFARNDLDATTDALTRAERDLASARQTLQRIEREENEGRYRAALDAANSVQPKLASIFPRIADLERQIADCVLDLAGAVAEGEEHFQTAATLAEQLSCVSDFRRQARRITLGDARLACQEALEQARAAADTLPVHEFLQPSGRTWKTAGLTAEEIAATEVYVAGQRAARAMSERDSAERAAFEAGVRDAPRLAKLEQDRLAAEKAKLEQQQKTEGANPNG